mgnify:CR=1 FL=1
MPSGGAREGGGRKKGSSNLRTARVAHALMNSGKSPLEVMVEAMRKVYEESGPVAAVPYAKECAPYMHPKIQSIEITGDEENPVRTVSEVYLKSFESDS